jgi:hypothetical protein
VKEVFTSSTTPPAETAFLFKAMNAISGGVTIAPASFAGGWLRMYVGVYDGLEDDILGPPQGTVSQFTALDKPGEYTGVLTLNTVIS